MIIPSLTQLMAVLNPPTPVDSVVPTRSAEIEKALQSATDFHWNQEVEDRDSAHLEHCLVEQDEGQVDPSFSPSPFEPFSQGGSREKVEQ